jgi:hypothetical protein
LRTDHRTKDYVARRLAEGHSKLDAIRALKRYLAREVSSRSSLSAAERSTPQRIETINGLYKAEVIHRRGPCRNFEAVEFATLEWVD